MSELRMSPVRIESVCRDMKMVSRLRAEMQTIVQTAGVLVVRAGSMMVTSPTPMVDATAVAKPMMRVRACICACRAVWYWTSHAGRSGVLSVAVMVPNNMVSFGL